MKRLRRLLNGLVIESLGIMTLVIVLGTSLAPQSQAPPADESSPVVVSHRPDAGVEE